MEDSGNETGAKRDPDVIDLTDSEEIPIPGNVGGEGGRKQLTDSGLARQLFAEEVREKQLSSALTMDPPPSLSLAVSLTSSSFCCCSHPSL